MEIQEIYEKIESLKNQALEIIKNEINNKEIPLNDRWKVFCEAGRKGLLPTSMWIERFEGEVGDYIKDNILNGDTIAKYETVNAERLVSYIEEDFECPKEWADDLKEQWMNKFIWSFKFDW